MRKNSLKSVATTDKTLAMDKVELTKRANKLQNAEMRRRGYPPEEEMQESLAQTYLTGFKKKGEMDSEKPPKGSKSRRTLWWSTPLEVETRVPPSVTTEAADELPTTPITVCARTTTPPRTTALP
jgi:hypothetical protein